MGAGCCRGVGPRLSPNGHVKNVLALLPLPPSERGRKARGPHGFCRTRVSLGPRCGRGQLCLPGLRCARPGLAFVSAGAGGHLPARSSRLEVAGTVFQGKAGGKTAVPTPTTCCNKGSSCRSAGYIILSVLEVSGNGSRELEVQTRNLLRCPGMDPELCTGLQGLQSWYVAVLADVAEKCRFAESESEGYTYASSLLPVC